MSLSSICWASGLRVRGPRGVASSSDVRRESGPLGLCRVVLPTELDRDSMWGTELWRAEDSSSGASLERVPGTIIELRPRACRLEPGSWMLYRRFCSTLAENSASAAALMDDMSSVEALRLWKLKGVLIPLAPPAGVAKPVGSTLLYS